jgi:hypothetical protein
MPNSPSPRISSTSGEPGFDYLHTYGVLQAAYMQQDAARLLRGAFGQPSSEFPKPIRDLRDLRNRATGHPVDAPAKKQPATFIARYSISGGRLMLLKVTHDGKWQNEPVDLRTMLKAHDSALQVWMEELVDELGRREETKRQDIAARGPISALMHPSWRYLISKIDEVTSAPDATAALDAQSFVSSLLQTLDDAVTGLADRGIDLPPSWHLKTARSALKRLDQLLPRAAAGEDVQLDIAAFVTLADKHLEYIATFLNETDEKLRPAS